MPLYTKRFLSESVNGGGIIVTYTTTANTNLIHTAVAGEVDYDEVWLFASNYNPDSDTLLFIGLQPSGGSITEAQLITTNVPSRMGLYTIMPGLVVNKAVEIRALADTANYITIFGYVNRITS
ncbi:MAG: hypothetical protein M0R51_13235 [Clostridia bacterium]|jgi:hypothetical protein|nr:hypothetical protein [Clostridia bacterium]